MLNNLDKEHITGVKTQYKSFSSENVRAQHIIERTIRKVDGRMETELLWKNEQINSVKPSKVY